MVQRMSVSRITHGTSEKQCNVRQLAIATMRACQGTRGGRIVEGATARAYSIGDLDAFLKVNKVNNKEKDIVVCS